MSTIAVVGNLSLDRVAGARPRIGGGPYHAARALRLLGARASAARALRGRRPPLPAPAPRGAGHPAATARPVRRPPRSRSRTTRAIRTMNIDVIGDAWTPDDVRALDRHVALGAGRAARAVRFSRRDACAARARTPRAARRPGAGAQAAGRAARARRRLRSRHSRARLDPQALRGGGASSSGDVDVPELLVTFGSAGSIVHANGRATRVPAWPLTRDPTGAGDGFSAAYLAARASGHAPVPAARRATAVVAAMLR